MSETNPPQPDPSAPPPLPVQPLEYQYHPTQKPPIEKIWQKFFAGLGISCAISAATWFIPDWNARGIENFLLPMMVILPVAKIAVGVPLTCIRRWRLAGIGVLIAIPLGFLLFFFGCFAAISNG